MYPVGSHVLEGLNTYMMRALSQWIQPIAFMSMRLNCVFTTKHCNIRSNMIERNKI